MLHKTHRRKAPMDHSGARSQTPVRSKQTSEQEALAVWVTTHESTLDQAEVKRLRATFSLIVAHSKRPNKFRSSVELMDESCATTGTTDKEDW